MTEHPKPHNYEAILQDGGQEPAELLKRLREGVLLNNNTVKYWTEPRVNSNCFMIYPRGLGIAWGEDSRYWKWFHEEDEQVEVAELLEVSWLDVHGKLEIDYLTPETRYEVAYIVMLKNHSGFEESVTLRLELPDGEMTERQLCLDRLEPDEWQEVKVGEFVAGSARAGEVRFCLRNIAGNWKKGLIVQGVRIAASPRRHI